MLAQVSRECGGQKCNGSIPNIKIKRAMFDQTKRTCNLPQRRARSVWNATKNAATRSAR